MHRWRCIVINCTPASTRGRNTPHKYCLTPHQHTAVLTLADANLPARPRESGAKRPVAVLGPRTRTRTAGRASRADPCRHLCCRGATRRHRHPRPMLGGAGAWRTSRLAVAVACAGCCRNVAMSCVFETERTVHGTRTSSHVPSCGGSFHPVSPVLWWELPPGKSSLWRQGWGRQWWRRRRRWWRQWWRWRGRWRRRWR